MQQKIEVHKQTPLPITQAHITAGVRNVANAIYKRYERQAILLVPVMKGGARFSKDLFAEMRSLGMRVDMEFIGARAYEKTERISLRDTVVYKAPSFHLIHKKRVIVVEDIISTGTTINHVCQTLHALQPRSIEVATFLAKAQMPRFVNPDYVAYRIAQDSPFLVGYGLDYSESFRELDEVREVTEEEMLTADAALTVKIADGRAVQLNATPEDEDTAKAGALE